jgi:hypothetical protein
MNSSKSLSKTATGTSDAVMSAQILLGPACQELLDVSFGELVLSSTHDERKEGREAPSNLHFESSVPSDVSVVSTAPSALSVESSTPSAFSDASLSKTSMGQIWVFDCLSRIHHHATSPMFAAEKAKELSSKVRDCSSRILVLCAMSPALTAEKAEALTLKIRDCLSRILVCHVMSPTSAAEKAKKLTLKVRDSSSRILHHVMTQALVTAQAECSIMPFCQHRWQTESTRS